jgi:uncharacterized membrane-anchored protein YhcB (DUF1043 family)
MDVTDRTIEQVLVELLQSENLWLIMLCCFLVGLAIGSILMILYFTKIRYYSLKNELEIKKTTLAQAEHERDEYKQKFEDVQNRIELFQNMEYARLATDSDIVPLPSSQN